MTIAILETIFDPFKDNPDITQLCMLSREGEQITYELPTDWDEVEVFQAMVKLDLEQVWIVPGNFKRNHALLDGGMYEEDVDGWHFKSFGDKFLSSMHSYKLSGSPAERKLRSIIWPEFSGWKWEIADGQVMLAGLNLLAENLECKISSSPGITGRNFTVKILTGMNRHHWLSSVKADLIELPFKQAGKDLAWKRNNLGSGASEVLYNLHVEWPGDWFVHCIDKNSMYLSACTALSLGIGDPHQSTTEELTAITTQHKIKAGLYRIVDKAPAPGTWDGYNMPDPLYGDDEKDNRQRWVTAPLLKLLYDLDFQVALLDGWQWNESRRIMEVPAHQLWLKRQALKIEMEKASNTLTQAALRFAYDAIKIIATSLIGLLASEKAIEKKYYRPDIWAGVVESAKARMFYNIQRIAENVGLMPFAAKTDSLWYLSRERDPHLALGAMLDRENDLGGFKVEYSLLIDHQVAEWLSEPEASDMASGLHELAQARLLAAREPYDYTDYEGEEEDEEEEDEEYYPDEDEEEEA